ncbi:hypothetical protein RB195_006528 [Necator americanus]|uniref:Uncharacterized protein n=1 Tax=Necator americanus TaxID=51031 RepID=A0ABR1BT19_NECAM
MIDESNPMRLARKAWNHLGLFTRQEAVELLSERLVSQKRRVLMKDCVRIIYYCHVQRSSGCRYEMSVCIPNNPDEKLRIDDFNVHTCNPDDTRLRRRAKPQIEDFAKPIEKRKPAGGSNSGRDDNPLPFSLSDSMTTFLSGLNDQFEVENDLEIEQNDFKCADRGIGPNENLARFISELGDTTKQAAAISRPGPSNVWTTVDIDVVDFSKRPDPPFTFVFHAKDEASQYSYACPMIGNQPEVVADALMNLFCLFGPPSSVKLESCYRGTVLEAMLSEKFPTTDVIFYAENRNKQGTYAPRREESMIRERIYAWLMENGKVNWFKHLNEIKYVHNSEWIDELGGTPMELFFGRPRSSEQSHTQRPDGSAHDDDAFSDTYTNNSNDPGVC